MGLQKHTFGSYMKRLFIIVAILVALLAMALAVSAAPTTIEDSTLDTATNDGHVGESEYTGYSNGINGGGGDVIGAQSRLYVDSGGPSHQINFALVPKPTTVLYDYVVIYIDSVPGGFTDTTLLNDKADPARQAISGGNAGNDAHLTFAPDFAADYAVAINPSAANLYQLADGNDNSHIHLSSANLTWNGSSTAAEYEFHFLMSDVGHSAGNSFKYMATYVNPLAPQFIRYTEFQGVSSATFSNNWVDSFSDFSLDVGDYNLFTTAGPTAVSYSYVGLRPAQHLGVHLLAILSMLLLGGLGLLALRPR